MHLHFQEMLLPRLQQQVPISCKTDMYLAANLFDPPFNNKNQTSKVVIFPILIFSSRVKLIFVTTYVHSTLVCTEHYLTALAALQYYYYYL